MFEDINTRFIEIDCGTKVKGDDIWVPSVIPGHKSSPDGYCVLTCVPDPENEGDMKIWTTDEPPPLGAIPFVALLEEKCPFRRQPKNKIPRYYLPQVWSGLTVCPIADMGLFIDMAFRKCCLLDLGPNPRYDLEYHNRDIPKDKSKPSRYKETQPIAWGLIAVWAPRLDGNPQTTKSIFDVTNANPDTQKGGSDDVSSFLDDNINMDTKPAYEAWLSHYKYFGEPMILPKTSKEKLIPNSIDFGDCDWSLFRDTLHMIDAKSFRTTFTDPCFADGRGEDLLTSKAISDRITTLAKSAPTGWYLLGYIPWKIFEVYYIPVDRKPDFLCEIKLLIENVLKTIADLRESDDPMLAYNNLYKDAIEKEEIARLRRTNRKIITKVDVQDLFDAISSET